MSRNSETMFNNVPAIDIQRSVFEIDNEHKTTFNVGDLIPICQPIEVMPGATHSIDTSKVIRMQPMVCSPFDNLFYDEFWFFVPNRLVWENFKYFMGEAKNNKWLDETTYSMPITNAPIQGWTKGTIADYFGLPLGHSGMQVNSLPFRAYALIVNEFFRDENLEDPCNITFTDATTSGSNGDNYITDLQKGGKPFRASKLHDVFTTCLPSPQKGPEVHIPIGDLPVMTDSRPSGASGITRPTVRWDCYNGNEKVTFPEGKGVSLFTVGTDGSMNYGDTQYNFNTAHKVMPNNLWAKATSDSFGTVNQLRQAFAIQKIYETLARGGSRMVEILHTCFGVTSPDARMQRPEYLGGKRIPINVSQVLQTSASTEDAPLGRVAGYSLTNDSDSCFTYSATEPGLIIGLGVVRYKHTYTNGLDKLWTKRDRFDYYWPMFANLGETAVMKREVDINGGNIVFGYQEAWYEYRNRRNYVSGQMRSEVTGSLDSWHFGDAPRNNIFLSEDFIKESPNNVDRCLAVNHTVADQLFMDILIKDKAVLPMPVYSIPGLIDHA